MHQRLLNPVTPGTRLEEILALAGSGIIKTFFRIEELVGFAGLATPYFAAVVGF